VEAPGPEEEAPLDVRPIQAAGGVVWRLAANEEGTNVEVAIIHRPRYDDWSIPKGKLAPGESLLEGGLREVAEETGYRVQVGRPLGEIRYLKKSGGGAREKVVHFWAMRAVGGGFSPGQEVDELRWLPLDQANELVTRATDREVLERFSRRPAGTGSVLLVRHGTAGSRSKWEPDDALRPLDEQGQEQAEELVRLLSRFGVEEIISADYVRCVETVQPLSEAIGVPVTEEPLLSERGFPGHEDEAVELIRNLGRPGGAVVACSQRQVIPELVARLAADDEVELDSELSVKKGGVWALSFYDHKLVGAEAFPPPKVSE
jgi:8-oxo-dGTP pyrophosphatase MutT (NUDIX family)/phosphohistidine phosphatase SixA